MAQRISKETVTIGILAIVFGLVAAYGVRSYLLREKPAAVEVKKKPELLKFLVASLDLPAGRAIVAGDIVNRQLTRQEAERKNWPLTMTMTNGKQVVGRRLREPLKQDDPFLTTSFYPAGNGPGIAAKLKPGYRALTLAISDVNGSEVNPEGFVDVLFRTTARPAKEGIAPIPEMTVPMLEHVEVLDVQRAASPVAANALVTLAIPMEQASRLEAVEGRGTFSLLPRPAEEMAKLSLAGSHGMTLEEALGIEQPAPTLRFQTIIYRRGVPQVNTFNGQILQTPPPSGGPAK